MSLPEIRRGSNPGDDFDPDAPPDDAEDLFGEPEAVTPDLRPGVIRCGTDAERWALTEAAVEAALAETGGWKKAVFRIAQTLRAAVAGDPNEQRPAVEEWLRRARPEGIGPDEAWEEFFDAYALCQWPKLFEAAKAKAREAAAPAFAAGYPPKLRLLVNLCRELQAIAGPRAFFLGCKDAAEFMGVTPKEASRKFKVLEANGVLAKVKRGVFLGRGKRSPATEWRYVALE